MIIAYLMSLVHFLGLFNKLIMNVWRRLDLILYRNLAFKPNAFYYTKRTILLHTKVFNFSQFCLK